MQNLVTIRDLHFRFADKELLKGVDFTVRSRDHIGIIGRNGSGKSTLFRLIRRELAPAHGTISFATGLRLTHLAQLSETVHMSVYDYCLEAFREVLDLEARLQVIAKGLKDDPHSVPLLREYEQVFARFEHLDGYSIYSRVRGILNGLGFLEEDYDKNIAFLSGGERRRLELARLLAEPCDLLLLDEPTNHLDLSAIRWLEGYLRNYSGAFLLITHDRYFLDSCVDRIFELENGKGVEYPGNYSDYVSLKRVRYEQEKREYIQAKRSYEAEMEKLRTFEARAARNQKFAARARDREKKIEKMDVPERPLWLDHSIRLDFGERRMSGEDVFQLIDLTMGFDDRILFEDLSLRLYRGERLAIIGDNGTGKTTLLHLLSGNKAPLRGWIHRGDQVDLGIYSQHQHHLSPSLTLIEQVNEAYPALEIGAIRHLLATFLFHTEEHHKLISALSGGEKARLSLLLLMLRKNNTLLLDEPTNHLDLPGKETLEEALLRYQGTLIVVSHDRYFVDRIAQRLLILKDDGQWELFEGTYKEWMASQETLEEKEQRPVKKPSRKAQQQKSPEKNKKIEELEERLLEEEEKLQQMELAFAEPSIYNEGHSVQEMMIKYEAQKTLVAELYEAWGKEQE